jgi:peptidoglycan/LPS O-acetylase OafA/YrhL
MTTDRVGSFDLLRLIAAFAVLWSHQFALMKLPEPSILGTTPSAIGLYIFFAISGYLNTNSLLRGQSSWRFLIRRARRIFPALIGLAIFCVLLGAILTTADGLVFWAKVPDFIFRNSTILFGIRYTLPGVFEANPYPGPMNGSLWTLPAEIKLYIYLALIAVVVRYRAAVLAGVLIVALIGFLIWFNVTTANPTEAHFNKFALLFIAGAALAILERRYGTVRAFVGLAMLSAVSGLTTAVAGWLPMMSLVFIAIGKSQTPRQIRPTIDLSYGVYLYAFPVQQVMAMSDLSFWPSLGAAVVTTTALAWLSARFIEQPALGAAQVRQPPALGPSRSEIMAKRG